MIPSDRLAAANRALQDAQSEFIQARAEADAQLMAMDPEERISNAQTAFNVAYASHDAATTALTAAKESGDVAAIEAAFTEFGKLATAERELALATQHLPPEPAVNPATPDVITQLNALVVGPR
jgi:alpha-D-ribose 1-methylphosphonate 5-triphosphate diphosphatase PhnM